MKDFVESTLLEAAIVLSMDEAVFAQIPEKEEKPDIKLSLSTTPTTLAQEVAEFAKGLLC